MNDPPIIPLEKRVEALEQAYEDLARLVEQILVARYRAVRQEGRSLRQKTLIVQSVSCKNHDEFRG